MWYYRKPSLSFWAEWFQINQFKPFKIRTKFNVTLKHYINIKLFVLFTSLFLKKRDRWASALAVVIQTKLGLRSRILGHRSNQRIATCSLTARSLIWRQTSGITTSDIFHVCCEVKTKVNILNLILSIKIFNYEYQRRS